MNVYDIPLYSPSEIAGKFSRMPYAERIKMIEKQVLEKFPDFNNIYDYLPLKENERLTLMIGPGCKLQVPTGMWISVLQSPSMGEYVELVKYRNDAPVLILGGYGTEVKSVRGMQADIYSLWLIASCYQLGINNDPMQLFENQCQKISEADTDQTIN